MARPVFQYCEEQINSSIMKKLKTIIPAVIALALIFSVFNGCKQGAEKQQEGEEMLNQLTEQEKEEGWKLLFDGETTEGWRNYNKETFPDSGWVVEDGTIRCIGSGHG